MTNLLIKKFIPDSDQTNNPKVREKYGSLSGGVGIFCNILLCVTKIVIGSLTASISITADGMNNLSDASSSIVTLLGAKMASKPADKEHPFGHGRMEYITALVVSFMILLMGFELGKSSFEKILNPQEIQFSVISLVVVCLTIPVKLWMAYFNNKLYKKSGVLSTKAVSKDSLNDCIATSATIIALLVSAFTKYNIDGYIGIAVAVIIIIAGINIIKEIIAPLLGQPPEKEVVDEITNIVLSQDIIVGVHDLIVHNYGPGRSIASIHAEIPADSDIMYAHDVIDNVEKEIYEKMNIVCVIHMDPLLLDDEKLNEAKSKTIEIITQIDEKLTLHDFRMVDGPTHTNLIFDVVVPYDLKISNDELKKTISEKLKQINPKFNAVIDIDHDFN